LAFGTDPHADTWPSSPAGTNLHAGGNWVVIAQFPPYAMGEHGRHNTLDLGPGPICSGNRAQPAFDIHCLDVSQQGTAPARQDPVFCVLCVRILSRQLLEGQLLSDVVFPEHIECCFPVSVLFGLSVDGETQGICCGHCGRFFRILFERADLHFSANTLSVDVGFPPAIYPY
jgi:hypothetical protein